MCSRTASTVAALSWSNDVSRQSFHIVVDGSPRSAWKVLFMTSPRRGCGCTHRKHREGSRSCHRIASIQYHSACVRIEALQLRRPRTEPVRGLTLCRYLLEDGVKGGPVPVLADRPAGDGGEPVAVPVGHVELHETAGLDADHFDTVVA